MASLPTTRPTRLPDRRPVAPLSPVRPPEGGEGPPPLLDTLVRILRRRKWWVLQALVIVPLIVALLTLQEQKKYTATANLLFRNVASSVLNDTTGGSLDDPTRDAATNQALIALPVVASRAAALLGDPSLTGRIAGDVSVSSTSDSDLVAINASDPSPRLAARIATAYGQAYIDFRRRSDRQQLGQAIALANAQLVALTAAERASATGAGLRDRLSRLQLAQSLLTGNAELVQPAIVPTHASSPKVKRNLLLGLLLGAVLGVGLGGLRERFDRSIKDEQELEEVYGVPVLARIPRSRKLSDPHPGEMAHSAEAEALRMLRANLRYFDVSGRLRSLLLSSPMSGDGKSTVARAMATAMASVGDHVVLVEADLRKPASPTLEGRLPQVGLSSVLAGAPLDDALMRLPIDASDGTPRYLTLLPAGPTPPNPLELLESHRMSTVLTELEHRFEVVLIDSPALSHVSDARPLVPMVSGVLIVSAIGHTTRPSAVDFRKQIELLEGKPLGVVENLAPAQRKSGYAYY